MPLIKASLEESQSGLIIPNGTWQHLTITDGCKALTYTKGNAATGSPAGNPMLTLTLEVADGEFRGARIFGHNVMVGGVNKDGNRMDTRRYRELVDAMAAEGVSWKCCGCGQEGNRRFEHDRRSGQLACPNCHDSKVEFETDSDNWQGRRVNGLCVTGTFFNSDEPRNELRTIRPYGDITTGS